jgi:hypothetical protein
VRRLEPLLVTVVAGCLAEAGLSAKVKAVLSGLRALGLALIAEALAEQDAPYQGARATVSCRCGQPAGRAGTRAQSRYTLLGKVTYVRTRFRCHSCRRYFFPLDEGLDLDAEHRGHSREFVCELVLLCTVMPFEKGGQLFQRAYGFAVSHTLAWKLAFTLGKAIHEREIEDAEALWKAREDEPERFCPNPLALRRTPRAKRLYVMMDNSKVGIHNGKRGRKAVKKPSCSGDESWRDARALLIFDDSARATNASGKRGLLLRRRVLAHVGSQDEWRMLVHKAFYEEGVYWAHEVVVVADGGSGLWKLIEDLLPQGSIPNVISILDWYHAAQHVWKVAKLLKGTTQDAKPSKAASRWVKGLLDLLEHGEVGAVLQRLRKITGGSPEARDELRKLINYIATHKLRMRYGWFRKRGLLIGSGAVESVHKWVIQARCKLPGMRWSTAGVNAILRLRCAWANDQWDRLFFPQPPKPPDARSQLHDFAEAP